MNEATVRGSAGCPDARMRGTLYLSGSEVTKDVDFSDSEIGGLVLNGLRGAALDLENATIGKIPDLTHSWPPKLVLDGLTYHSVGAAEEFDRWLPRMDHYAPQPYEQLATVVQRQGDGALATTIRYSGRERERTAAKGWQWLWLSALKWVIGYGYRPERSALWAFGLVLLGAIVLRVSGEGPRNAMPYGLAYSFDILLPIIRLRDKHYSVDLQSWARYYFYLHRIMGFLLASFLIAGVSGLTK
jgi:hypothetical protein